MKKLEIKRLLAPFVASMAFTGSVFAQGYDIDVAYGLCECQVKANDGKTWVRVFYEGGWSLDDCKDEKTGYQNSNGVGNAKCYFTPNGGNKFLIKN